MTLLDKKAVTLEGVQDICWSPADNVLAVFQQEHGNLPARVALLSLPDKRELRQKNLFAVAGAKLFWHPQGSYLAVHVRADGLFAGACTHRVWCLCVECCCSGMPTGFLTADATACAGLLGAPRSKLDCAHRLGSVSTRIMQHAAVENK